MFQKNENQSIYVTRGDCCAFDVPAVINGKKTQFKTGDIVRFKVTRKKDCNTVVCQRDFQVNADTDSIEISLSGEDTRYGEVISKPTDFWYEVELNPDTNPQTIVGYDEKGAKIFRLFPEGADVNAEDIEVVGKKTLQDLVDCALEEAKNSGAFTGPKGDKGEPGQLQTLNGIRPDENGNVEIQQNIVINGFEVKNYVDGIAVYGGYLGHDGTLQPYEWANQATVYTEKFAVTPGEVFSVTYKQPLQETGKGSLMWRAYGLYDASGNWLRREPQGAVEGIEQDEHYIYTEEITVPSDVGYMCVMCRSNIFAQGTVTDLWGETATPPQDVLYNVFTVYNKSELVKVEINDRLLPKVSAVDNGKDLGVSGGKWVKKVPSAQYENPNIKAVNHRGYNMLAPENTLSAFRLSKKMGFQYVECDVAFTSDGVAVLLHDETVDRTSNGTGKITELTFDAVRELDFGSWKSADYAGEQIPFFEEFLILCKNLGLHPYIEVKYETMLEDSRVSQIVSIVNRCGMRGKVTYISFSPWYLTLIKNMDDRARLGLVVNDVTETTITQATELKTEHNEVFIDVGYWQLPNEAVELCAANGIPLEVWTINDPVALVDLDVYVSGYTSDNLRANVILYDAHG